MPAVMKLRKDFFFLVGGRTEPVPSWKSRMDAITDVLTAQFQQQEAAAGTRKYSLLSQEAEK